MAQSIGNIGLRMVDDEQISTSSKHLLSRFHDEMKDLWEVIF